jgi:hypothetical protein
VLQHVCTLIAIPFFYLCVWHARAFSLMGLHSIYVTCQHLARSYFNHHLEHLHPSHLHPPHACKCAETSVLAGRVMGKRLGKVEAAKHKHLPTMSQAVMSIQCALATGTCSFGFGVLEQNVKIVLSKVAIRARGSTHAWSSTLPLTHACICTCPHSHCGHPSMHAYVQPSHASICTAHPCMHMYMPSFALQSPKHACICTTLPCFHMYSPPMHAYVQPSFALQSPKHACMVEAGCFLRFDLYTMQLPTHVVKFSSI